MTTSPYDLARQGAVILDRPDRGLVGVAGADRASWLQGLVTNDVAALGAGRGCYAALLTSQGRMVTDLRVFDLGDQLWLDVPACSIEQLLARLDMFVITEDVQLLDLTTSFPRTGVHGPAAAQVLDRALGRIAPGNGSDRRRDTLEALVEDHLVVFETSGARAIVSATRDLGVSGFDVYGPAGAVSSVRAALLDAGLPVLDTAAWTALRIEAGRPLFGMDMDEDTIPLEAGLDRAISFTKGCYVGQEVIVRVRDRGHGRVARRLVGLAASGVPDEARTASAPGDGPAASGDDRERSPAAALVAPGDVLAAEGRDVGRITSAAFSPALGRTVALGYVHRDFTAPATWLTARHDEGTVALEVCVLPLATFRA